MRHKVLIICRRQIQENTATLAMSRINAFSRRDVNRILLVHSWQAWQPSPHRLLRNNNMTRGNQRDLARARNAKKQGNDKGKKADDGMSAAARKLRDAEIMQQKQKKANDPKPADEKAK